MELDAARVPARPVAAQPVCGLRFEERGGWLAGQRSTGVGNSHRPTPEAAQKNR